ncbi:hypothetical protein GC56T3_0683 [Geobacillus sp. C56-T3]|nr:hypothetical protein GC56T3_0683 [Geobacillus sp. C56-T3]
MKKAGLNMGASFLLALLHFFFDGCNRLAVGPFFGENGS